MFSVIKKSSSLEVARGWPWLLMCLLACALGRATAAELSVLATNGPAANRIDITFVSEGYTASELDGFLDDAREAAGFILSEPPFSDYTNSFNLFALSVASAESGSDHPVSAATVDTYFNSTYDPYSDRLISIPPNFVDPNPAAGVGKLESLLASLIPRTDVAILLVNDPLSGGSDGGGILAIASTGSLLGAILPHELGHLLANLGDEYDSPYPGFPDIEEPNTTRETDRNKIKWKAWIDEATPVPTPVSGLYWDTVGLFEGAHYHTKGWYRPQLNCAMRSVGVPFCRVCSEALVLSFYQNVRPIDGWLPVETNLVSSSGEPLSLEVQLVSPTSHALEVQWALNGLPIPEATATTLTISPQELGEGTHELEALVRDPTSRVRTDPENLLEQSVHWQVQVSLPWIELSSIQLRGDGRLTFDIRGRAPAGFAVESSVNLVDWHPELTNHLDNGQYHYEGAWSAGDTGRYYRAVALP